MNREPALIRDAAVERRARVRREDVKRRGLDALLDRPLDRALEHRVVVAVHPEDEAPVDHHAKVVQAANGRGVVAAHVLVLPLLGEIRRVERLESDEEASQSRHPPPAREDRARARHSPSRQLARGVPCRACPRRAPTRSGDRRTGDRRGSTDDGPAGARSRPAPHRRSGYRRSVRLRRTPPCSRSRTRAGSRARRRWSSGRDRAAA